MFVTWKSGQSVSIYKTGSRNCLKNGLIKWNLKFLSDTFPMFLYTCNYVFGPLTILLISSSEFNEKSLGKSLFNSLIERYLFLNLSGIYILATIFSMSYRILLPFGAILFQYSATPWLILLLTIIDFSWKVDYVFKYSSYFSNSSFSSFERLIMILISYLSPTLDSSWTLSVHTNTLSVLAKITAGFDLGTPTSSSSGFSIVLHAISSVCLTD